MKFNLIKYEYITVIYYLVLLKSPVIYLLKV